MNRSHSRFVSHDRAVSHSRFVPYNRPVYSQRQSRASGSVRHERLSMPVNSINPARQPNSVKSVKSARHSDKTTYWFPIVTMVASVLFAVYAVVPRSVFDAFASDNRIYSISITSEEGSFSVTLTGDNTMNINLSGDEAVKTVNAEEGTVTYDLDLTSDLTNFDIVSQAPINSLSFGTDADGVTVIDASDSGLARLDVSHCSGLEHLTVANCPIESNLLGIEYASHDGQYIYIGTPVFSYNDSGVLFELKGFGDADDLTVKQNKKTLKAVDGHYCIPYVDLKEDLTDDTSGMASVEISKADKPGVTYSFTILNYDVSNSDILNPKDEQDSHVSGQGGIGQSGKDDVQNDKDDNKKDDNENDVPNVKLTIEDKSKSIIKDAYIENVTGVDSGSLKAVAKALTVANRNTLLATVKKADKNFDDQNADMLVYDIYLTDKNGKKVSVKGKAGVTLTLAYPSREVGYLYDEYDYTVYHQLADKSIDKSINAYGTKDGIQFTTDSFSAFVISCSKSESNYADLTIDDSSKSIISSAKVHGGVVFTVDDKEIDIDKCRIIAQPVTSEIKKELIADIKKADKNFSAEEKNISVYDVFIADEDGNKVKITGKVDFTLAYPNDNVKKNYGEFGYTVYHQLADKSIDSKQIAVGGKNGITVTTDSFSVFAVASTPKPTGSDVPKTGESTIAANIAFLLAMLSMVSFAAVYAKNKAEQY